MTDQPQDPQALLAGLELYLWSPLASVSLFTYAESKLHEWAAQHGAIWGYDVGGVPYIQRYPGAPYLYSSSTEPVKDMDND